jgi:hypothetical protein
VFTPGLTAGFFYETNEAKATLRREVQSVIPKPLLEKLRRRKLFVRTYEEQQLHSQHVKLV